MNAPVSPATLTIRPMLPEDLDAVFAIEQRIFPTPWSLTSYHFEMNNPISHKWVAESEDDTGNMVIAGMAIVWLLVDEAHIGNIGVDDPYRRRGIGCRLLKTALISLINMGALKASLEVRASNQAALALYRRFGFIESDRRKGYYVDNQEDALILTLPKMSRETIGAIPCPAE